MSDNILSDIADENSTLRSRLEAAEKERDHFVSMLDMTEKMRLQLQKELGAQKEATHAAQTDRKAWEEEAVEHKATAAMYKAALEQMTERHTHVQNLLTKAESERDVVRAERDENQKRLAALQARVVLGRTQLRESVEDADELRDCAHAEVAAARVEAETLRARNVQLEEGLKNAVTHLERAGCYSWAKEARSALSGAPDASLPKPACAKCKGTGLIYEEGSIWIGSDGQECGVFPGKAPCPDCSLPKLENP